MTDFRALCATVLAYNEGRDKYNFSHLEDYDRDNAAFDAWQEIKAELKSALAQPEPEGPTDAELLELMPETMRDEFSYAAKVCSDATGGQVKPGIFRVCLNTAALEFARAVLARWGTSNLAETRSSSGDALQPIPVSERLPGPGECLDEGWAWFFNPRTGWRQATQPVHSTYTHWLPANALPLPPQ